MEIVRNLFKLYKEKKRKTKPQFLGKCEVHLRNHGQKKGTKNTSHVSPEQTNS